MAGDEQVERFGAGVRWTTFDPEIIILCVRWYLRYKLSLRDLVEMMAERGLSLAHAPTTEGSPRGEEVPVGYDDHALGKALYAGVR